MAIAKLRTVFFDGAWIPKVKTFFTKINEIIDWINLNGKTYKVYSALLTQSSTNAPVSVVLENTLGTINISYDSTGYYYFTSNGLFTQDKTFTIMSSGGNTSSLQRVAVAVWEDSSNISIQTGTVGSPVTASDGMLTNTSFEIRVYN